MTTMRWAALALMAPLMFTNPTGSEAQTGQPLPIPPITLNPSTSLTLTPPLLSEVPVSPITPGTVPGTLFNETTGTNSFTGLPCSVEGSLSIGGTAALPGTTANPETDMPTDQLQAPMGVFGSETGPGPC
jgi:hypothetical protein